MITTVFIVKSVTREDAAIVERVVDNALFNADTVNGVEWKITERIEDRCERCEEIVRHFTNTSNGELVCRDCWIDGEDRE